MRLFILAVGPLFGALLLAAALLSRAWPDPYRGSSPSRCSTRDAGSQAGSRTSPDVARPIPDAFEPLEAAPETEEHAALREALRHLETVLERPDLSAEDRESCLRLIPVIRAKTNGRPQ
ncbi:MAG: hypothetical protein FD180_873 [Planctomycetota bacterium]|nr:MAG: hypothetical protein FD180_873 [Planctomycetota bacterium]